MKRKLNLILGVILGIALAISLVAIAFPTTFSNIDLSSIAGKAVSVFAPEEKEYHIADQCGPIMGNLMHTIDSEASCTQKCKIKCLEKDEKYNHVEFTREVSICNTCMCYCS